MSDAAGPKRAAATRGELELQTALKHRFLQQIDVKITTGYAGTDNEPVLVSCLTQSGACQAVGSVAGGQLAAHALLPPARTCC